MRTCKNWSDAGRAKEQQRLLGATKNLGRGKERSSPRAFRGSMALPTPGFWTWNFHNCGKARFCCFKPPGLWSFSVAVPSLGLG